METKYSIQFTGRFLNPDQETVIGNLTSFFSNLQHSEIESLVKNNSTFKKSVDLSYANKIKSKFEQAGAECLIFIENANNINSAPALETALIDKVDNNKKAGILIITSSAFLILCAILLSDGYDPRAGLLWSLSESMYLYEGYPFGCSGIEIHSSGLHRTPDGKLASDYSSMTIVDGCKDSWHIKILTRYTLLISLCMGMFGIGRYLGAIRPIQHYWSRVKAALD